MEGRLECIDVNVRMIGMTGRDDEIGVEFAEGGPVDRPMGLIGVVRDGRNRSGQGIAFVRTPDERPFTADLAKDVGRGGVEADGPEHGSGAYVRGGLRIGRNPQNKPCRRCEV